MRCLGFPERSLQRRQRQGERESRALQPAAPAYPTTTKTAGGGGMMRRQAQTERASPTNVHGSPSCGVAALLAVCRKKKNNRRLCMEEGGRRESCIFRLEGGRHTCRGARAGGFVMGKPFRGKAVSCWEGRRECLSSMHNSTIIIINISRDMYMFTRARCSACREDVATLRAVHACAAARAPQGPRSPTRPRPPAARRALRARRGKPPLR